jgi:hypothetical protein
VLGLLAILVMIGCVVGAIYYLIGAVLVVIGVHLGGGRRWVQLGAWITAVPVLVLVAVVLLESGEAR